MEDNGSMSGYGYEFYQMMLRYCNWDYEYIGFEQSWSGIMGMLDRGEVDVVTLANKTPEREEKYLYSENPIGTASSVITTRAENTQIVPGDYTTYDEKILVLSKTVLITQDLKNMQRNMDLITMSYIMTAPRMH